jgi:hypothetical protein
MGELKMSDKYIDAVKRIIHDQEQLIGPLALDLARGAGGLVVSGMQEVALQGDPKTVLENLVVQYTRVFGNASVQVSKSAIRKAGVTFSVEELPEILK